MKIKAEFGIIIIEDEILSKICSYSGQKEKIGYLIGYKLQGLDEFEIFDISRPNARDISTETYSKISKKHIKVAKKQIQLLSRQSFIFGFWHTHPIGFGHKMSNIDFDVFRDTTQGKNKIFIVATGIRATIYIYINGVCAKEAEWINE